ncbi:MAG TPA: ABC transporter substrate-binding protein [Candidatus Merdenecus merdavium]|nr:ABC transporter substrate-binding protein [Candidatus Merdenecus merdavium]
MKRKLLAFILSMTMVLSLAGCSDPQTNETDKNTEKESSNSQSAGEEESGDTKASGIETQSNNSESKDVSSNQKDLEKVTFVLDWTPNTNHTGLYVAQEKGYFAENGLEVEIVQPPEDGADLLVASGKAQFGVSFQDSMAPAIVGDHALPISAIAALIQHNTSGIVSRAGEGVDKPKGLEGKKYATWDAPIEKAMIKNVVEGDGGDFGQVELIPSTVTDEVSALRSKSVDAIWIYYAWGGIAMENADLETDYFAFSDLNPVFDYYTPVLIGNNDYMKENTEVTKGFLEALKKGYEDAIKDPQEAAEILCQSSPELDPDLVLASQQYLANQYKAEVDQWGYIDPVRWNEFYNWLNENDLSEETIPENTGFTNEYLPQ